jgi:N-acetylglutamate synthase-like GNAT family acetyltransferase
MTKYRLRRAVRSDIPRISVIWRGAAENRPRVPASISNAEVAWYIAEGIFLVSEDAIGIQGFACADRQTGYVAGLFVANTVQRRGHGTALMNAVLGQLRNASHRQAFLATGRGTLAEKYYLARGWHRTGINMDGDVVLRLWL